MTRSLSRFFVAHYGAHTSDVALAQERGVR